MATIRIYKYVMGDDGETERVYRYTVPNLDNMTVQYNTPISPMPLPEEDADENILVKIEGNSASIDIDWTLADYTYTANDGTCHFEEWNSKFGAEQSPEQILVVKSGDSRGKFDPVAGAPAEPLDFRDMSENTSESSKQIAMFRKYFESKSLNNDYCITIEDGSGDGYGTSTVPTRWYGSISQMSFSISGTSPIVWRARIQFFVGNVITVYDPDSPESPQSMTGVYKTGTVDGNAWGTRDLIKVRFRDPTSFGATDINEVEIMYREEGRLEWASVTYDIATDTSDGAANKLTKISGGADNNYYVVYLPPAKEGDDGARNYGGATNGATNSLTSSNPAGLFNVTTYVSATGTWNDNGTTRPIYGLTGDKYYTVKVHFRNTSGEGGLATDTVQLTTET